MTHTRSALLSIIALAATLVAVGCGEPTSQSPSTSPSPLAATQSAPSAQEPDEPIPSVALAPARETAPAAREARAAAAPTEGLTVRRLALTRAVEDREPVDAAARFSSRDEPLYAFLEMANNGDEEEEIEVTFVHEGGASVGHVTLTVPADTGRYRTWALSRYVQQRGAWTAVITDRDGTTLDSAHFEIL